MIIIGHPVDAFTVYIFITKLAEMLTQEFDGAVIRGSSQDPDFYNLIKPGPLCANHRKYTGEDILFRPKVSYYFLRYSGNGCHSRAQPADDFSTENLSMFSTMNCG